MKRLFVIAILWGIAVAGVQANDNTVYVNPFIGTQTDATGALSGSTYTCTCCIYSNTRHY